MARAQSPLVPLLHTLNDLTGWLAAARASGVVIGGVAASLLGRPRVTRDVDVLVFVDEAAWSDFLARGVKFGFSPRRPDAIEFARTSRVLLVRHEPSGVDVDVVLGALPFEEEVIARVVPVEIGGIRIPLPTAEDLIIMKSVAGRARDVGDIESLLAANPKLDLRRVRRWVREFSTALAQPDIYERLQTLLPASRRKVVRKKRGRRRTRLARK